MFMLINSPKALGAALLGLFLLLTAANSPGQSPLVPPLLDATVAAQGSLSATWIDRSDETQFRLQWRASGQVVWHELTVRPANSTSWTVNGLPDKTAYDFRVRAEAGSVVSEWSNLATATTPTASYDAVVTFLSTTVTLPSQTARLQAQVNTHTADSTVFYGYVGLSPESLFYDYSSYTSVYGWGLHDVSMYVSASNPGTRYYCRMLATNPYGPSQSPILTFVTPGATAPLPPGIVSKGVHYLASTSVRIDSGIFPDTLPADVVVEYGPTDAFGSATNPVTAPASSTEVPIQIDLVGLNPATTYYYRIVATNTSGPSNGSTLTFTTQAAPPPLTGPDLIVGDLTNLAPSGVTFNAKVNPNGAATGLKVEYGTTSAYGSEATLDVAAGTSPVPVSVPLNGLTQHTTYFYRLSATSSDGAITDAPNSFLTPPQLMKPEITAVSVSSIGLTSSQINGASNPHASSTSYVVEYGTSQSLGQSSASALIGSGADPVSLHSDLSNLTRNTVYYYRVKATNSLGTVTTSIQSFATPPATDAPWLSAPAAAVVAATSASVTGQLNPKGGPASYVVEYGTTPSFGQSSSSHPIGENTNSVFISETLIGLTPDTLYYWRFLATNEVGHGVSVTSTFRTAANAAAPTISQVAATDATVKASLNPQGADTTYVVQYGATSSLGQASAAASIGSGSAPVSVTASLPGLAPHAVYFYRLAATNSGGTSYSAIGSFKSSGGTSGPSMDLPTLDDITETGFHVYATAGVYGSTQSYPPAVSVQYGTTPALGQSATGMWNYGGSVSATGLLPNTVYYYQLTMSTSAGTDRSLIGTFISAPHGDPALRPAISSIIISDILSTTGTISASVDPKGNRDEIFGRVWLHRGAGAEHPGRRSRLWQRPHRRLDRAHRSHAGRALLLSGQRGECRGHDRQQHRHLHHRPAE
jgi:phosphodiesterase/alkaline phosphatase D-like protein